MSYHTDLDQDNIRTIDYKELWEVDPPGVWGSTWKMRWKMASCYYKTRQGIIKQEEFTLSVDDKSKLPTDYSNAPIPTYKVAQIVHGAIIASLSNCFTSFSTIFEKIMSTTLEKNLCSHKWVTDSQFLGGASTS